MNPEPPRTRLIVTGLVVVLMSTVYAHIVSMLGADGRRFLPPFQSRVVRESLTHLGGENFKIGFHVARGQGFSDPYGVGTRPTAWMPPVYPLLCTGLILVFGKDVDAIGTVMAGAQAIGLMVVWCLLVGVARPRSRAGGLVLLSVFVVFLLTHFHYSFLFTHDYFVAILGLACILRFAPGVAPPQTWRGWAGWGLVGGLATLATPALAAPWGLITAAALWPFRPGMTTRGDRSPNLSGQVRRPVPTDPDACHWRLRGPMVAGLVFVVVLAPWTIRNAVVFGTFVPVKSNAVYELYQSLKSSENGLVTIEALRHHPGNVGPEMNEYRELGEAAYIARKREQVWELLKEHPDRYLRHCVYRLWVMSVWDVPFFQEPGWAIPRWFCRLTYPLPAIGLCVIVFRRWWRYDPAASVAVLAAVGLAIPYVLLSYYDRYEYAFGPAKMLLTYYGLKALVRWKQIDSPPDATLTPAQSASAS